MLLLFRPFLKVEILNSDISPRQNCTQSVRGIDGLRCSIVILTHLIATACITHLINLSDPLAACDLAQGVRDLNKLAESHAIAKRYLHIIVGLSEQWRMRLPESVIKAIRELKSVTVPGALCAPQGTSPSQAPYYPTQPQCTHRYGHEDLLPNNTPVPTLINSVNPSYNHTDLFWSPFPDQSLPLQPTSEVDSMDVAAVLENSDLDQSLSRDGFKWLP